MVLGDWVGADLGSSGDDDAKERYLHRVCGGGFGFEVGGANGNFLCGGGYFLDCTYSLG